jgi:4-hydroxy-tetrahydrodipicolinate synthase
MNVFAGERPVECFRLGAVGYVNPFGNYIPFATTRMWEYLDAGMEGQANDIQQRVRKIYDIIAEGHPTYGHQCYSKALAAAAGYPVGDVRPPLTTFDSLGAEGRQRCDSIVELMHGLDAYVSSIEGKVKFG